MSNNKNEEKKKEGSFDPGCVADIYDELSGHNYALRAFGALLGSSALHDFADQDLGDTLKSDNFKAADLRWGLSQIIDLYLEHQERVIKAYVKQYLESDYERIRYVKTNIELVDQGAFGTKEAAIDALHKAIENLDIMINRGGELKGMAEELKDYCMTYLRPMTEKTKG